MESITSTWSFRSLVLTLALTLTACGGSKSSGGDVTPAPDVQTPDTPTPTYNWNAPRGVTGSVRNILNTESLADVAVQVYDSADLENGGELPTAASFIMTPLLVVYTDA